MPIQAFKERIADLPINTSLADTLALSFRFNTPEFADSGLWDRAQAAQQRADDLIDRASRLLDPFNIDRDELGRFVLDEIKRRRSDDRLSL